MNSSAIDRLLSLPRRPEQTWQAASKGQQGWMGQALVEIKGERIYLGLYGTPESRSAYDEIVANLLAGRTLHQMKQARPEATPDQTIPAKCLHRGTGHAYVTINGQEIYLGPHGNPESDLKYRQLIAEWLENHRILLVKYRPTEGKLIAAGVAEYLQKLDDEYKSQAKASEPLVIKSILAVLIELYATTRIIDFGADELKGVRRLMINRGWKRKSINKKISRLRAVFKWFMSQGYYSHEKLAQLECIEPLKEGKCDAAESSDIRPVNPEYVQAVLDEAGRQIKAIILLQELTAARPGEWLIARPMDIERGEKGWLYRPVQFKSKHRNVDKEKYFRVIPLGPQGRQIVESFLKDRPADAYLFSPREAKADLPGDHILEELDDFIVDAPALGAVQHLLDGAAGRNGSADGEKKGGKDAKPQIAEPAMDGAIAQWIEADKEAKKWDVRKCVDNPLWLKVKWRDGADGHVLVAYSWGPTWTGYIGRCARLPSPLHPAVQAEHDRGGVKTTAAMGIAHCSTSTSTSIIGQSSGRLGVIAYVMRLFATVNAEPALAVGEQLATSRCAARGTRRRTRDVAGSATE